MTALPPDSHVHTEWSWDAVRGSMEGACAQAVKLGLPAIVFTDHAEFAGFKLHVEEPEPLLVPITSPDGVTSPPLTDLDGYLETVDRCRKAFPGLRILSGAELSEPHRHEERVKEFLAAGNLDRVIASVHSLRFEDYFVEPSYLLRHLPPDVVVREYLAEVVRMIEGSDVFAVLAHIDYPIRYLPKSAESFDPFAFEDEFRHALQTLADSGRALEVNTRLPMDRQILRWWHELGGEAVSFGSDAHEPDLVANGFAEAAAMVEANGFKPGVHPHDFWVRG